KKTLVVKGDSSASRLKVISCIKARKYIKRGHQLFVTHVTEKEPKEKRLEYVPVIRYFPEVFPDDLPGLSPPRKVEFKIELVPGVAPFARAPYRLAPFEIKELADQLQELSEKGFIRPSSSPWGLREEDIPITAFRTRYGHYEFQGKEEHGEHLKTIMELLKKEQLIMPPKAMSQAVIERLITQRVNAALEMERAKQALGTQLDMSTVYHPQMDGQSKKIIQTLKDMLRACMIDFRGHSKFWKDVAYKLELSRELKGIYNTFHVLNLKKCLSDESLIILLDEIQLDDKLHFIKEPVEIMDREVKRLKQSRIPIIKVRWNSRRGPKYTWEREDQMKSKYTHLFTSGPRADKSN
nr:putative reverse transcriptase domain-containing protein [Tanacetum cinerariifolium]